jgi:monovalent cation:H+ antiporter-2, CPA2 family
MLDPLASPGDLAGLFPAALPALLPLSTPAFMGEVVALIGACTVIAYLCQRVRIVPIVGFLLAGVLLGPNALGLVQDMEVIDAVAEVGVILLLFTIGIEFSLEKLARIKRFIFLGGGLQVGLCVTAVALLLMALGVPWRSGIFTGCLIALSSTAIVLKILADRSETNSPAGLVSLGVLIFQDLAVIVMVLLVPLLGGTGGTAAELLWALARAGALIALVLLVARRIMPRLLEAVARTCSPELFLLTVVAVCFGTAWVTSLAGVSVSLGAFMAGLLVSESRFSEHALGEILPLRILFSAAFFVSVGLLLDVRFLAAHLPLVVGVVVAVLLVKAATTGAGVLALGQGPAVAAAAGLLLAQVGEFSFVLERAGREVGLHPAGRADIGGQAFLAGSVVLMVLTPLLAAGGTRLQELLVRRRVAAPALAAMAAAGTAGEPFDAVPVEGPAAGFEGHVLVAGYGAAARPLVRALRGAGIPFVILTLSPTGADEATAEGMVVLPGDYSRLHLLQLAGVERARLLVVADDEPARTHHVVSVARMANPALTIVARTRATAEAAALREAGADRVVADELEGLTRLFSDVLEAYEVAPAEVEIQVEQLRTQGELASLPAIAREGVALLPGKVFRLSEQERATRRCGHAGQAREVAARAAGCEECLASGDTWVHLRVCLSCGHVGCCDSSKNRHARGHFQETDHPIMKSAEPGESWSWCFVDRTEL